jgi:predicted lipid-binding transport protein (Tim44 family)
MINKISHTPNVSRPSKQRRSSESKKIEVEKTGASQPVAKHLAETVIQAVSKEKIKTEAELRKKLILETLTQALGDKASNERLFKQLADKIDDALGHSHVSQAQLLALLEKINT